MENTSQKLSCRVGLTNWPHVEASCLGNKTNVVATLRCFPRGAYTPRALTKDVVEHHKGGRLYVYVVGVLECEYTLAVTRINETHDNENMF